LFRKLLPDHFLRLGDQIAFREAQGVVSSAAIFVGAGTTARNGSPMMRAYSRSVK
jgi:hypothetical protein